MAKTASRKDLRSKSARSSRAKAAPPKPESRPLNRSLHAAKAAKQDEFYTQYVDFQKEVEAYLEFDPDSRLGCQFAGANERADEVRDLLGMGAVSLRQPADSARLTAFFRTAKTLAARRRFVQPERAVSEVMRDARIERLHRLGLCGCRLRY
jgi:hypothetical protein